MSTVVERTVSAESAKHYIDGIVSLARAGEGVEVRTLISRLRERIPYQNHEDILRVVGEIETLSTQTSPDYKRIEERLNHLGCTILSYRIREN